jgi:DHA1 family multidrug resistance protein-like MFS transporter
MLPLLLTDIAKTFNVPVGTASSISAVSALAGIAIGLILAFVSLRFKHKSLLSVGVLSITIAALGSYLAPSFLMMQIFYSLNGVGSVMVGAMAYTLIGDNISTEKKGKAVGWMVAAGFLAFTIGAPITGMIATIGGGWRPTMLWFVLPISLVSLTVALIVLPSKLTEKSPKEKISLVASFKQALSNKSAFACLIGTMFAFATGAITTFVISYWRSEFGLTTSMGSIITAVNATVAAVGGLMAGRLINRTGRKLIIIPAIFLESILIILTVFMPTLSLSWGVSVIRVFCYGMLSAGYASLTLEQNPKYRASTMSLRGTFLGIGGFIGIVLGGTTLNLYNYQAVGFVLAALGIMSMIMVTLFVKDPQTTL